MKLRRYSHSMYGHVGALALFIFVFLNCIGLKAQTLEFAQETIDVGLTSWYQPITATFNFKNVSGHDVQIIDVDPGCGCMMPTWTQGLVRDGGKGVINVTYNAEMLGRFDHNIVVIVKGEKPIFIRMLCKVVSEKVEQKKQDDNGWNDDVVDNNVDNDIVDKHEPGETLTGPIISIPLDRIVVGKYKARKLYKGKVIIKNTGNDLLLINGVRPLSHAIGVKDVKLGLKPGKIYTLKFTLDAWKMTSKEEQCEMIIESNDPARKNYSIFISCE